MLLHVRSGWAHYRATTADFFNSRRSIPMPGVCWNDDPNAGAGGGGGGGNGGNGTGAGAGDAGGAGGWGGTDEAAKKAEQDRKLAAEAAGWRTKLRDKEKEFEEHRASTLTQIEQLNAQIAEMQSRLETANPQGGKDGANGNGTGKPDPEIANLRRTVTQLSNDLKTEREQLAKERKQLRDEKIGRKVTEIVSEGKFVMPTILRKMLGEKIDISTDGQLVLKVKNEVGGIDEVEATLDNVMKYKPVDDFDSFVKSEGSGGSGSNGGGNRPANDGIDWNRVKANDLDYIAANLTKINAAIAAGARQ